MKSLQIVTPHKKCIFNCPFCISKSHSHNNCFENTYEKDFNKWKNNLEELINNNSDLECVVITGTNEPMQSKECVKDIINIVRNVNPNIRIEIQTRMYKPDDIYKLLDVTCYSISDFKIINKIKVLGKTIRYVFILTDSFNNKRLEDIIKLIPKEVTQLTFKTLHNSNGQNKTLDAWIGEHKIDDESLNNLINDINNYQGNLSIRADLNCMDSTNRYKVFREDANLYNDWN